MNELQSNVICLIKRALFHSGDELSIDMPWGDIFRLGKAHRIIPVLCEGLLDSNLPEQIKNTFSAEYLPQALVHFNQMSKLSSIEKAFLEGGIDYMLLKGKNLKSLYPKPEMRTMSDIDILIKPDQYKEIRKKLLLMGFIEKGESNHEFIWSDNKFVNLELHKILIPSYNHDFAAYFGTGWERAVKKDPDKTSYSLIPEDELIFIFTHFAKHYRDGGIGLRHMIDLYLFGKAHPNMDEKYLEIEFLKLDLFDFYKNVRRTLFVWFEGEAPDSATELITDKVFKSGSFGTEESVSAASAVKISNRHKTALGSKTSFLFNLAFPSLSVMRKNFPVLEKHAWLLPFLWVVRAFKGVFFKRQLFKENLLKYKSINKKTVSTYREELQSVGLKHDF